MGLKKSFKKSCKGVFCVCFVEAMRDEEIRGMIFIRTRIKTV